MMVFSRVKQAVLGLTLLCIPLSASAKQTPEYPQSEPHADSPRPWTHGCKRIGSEEICELVQLLVDKRTGENVIRIAFAKQKSSGRVGLMIKAPLGVRLDTGALLQINGEAAVGIENIVFQRCFADGCIAEKPLTSEEVKRISSADTLRLVVLDLQANPMIIDLAVADLKSEMERL